MPHQMLSLMAVNHQKSSLLSGTERVKAQICMTCMPERERPLKREHP